MGKTEQTKSRVRQVALDLFTTRGFDQTTVAEVAAAAGVTAMTVFRHFATKEQLILDDPYDPMIAASVAGQPSHWSVLDRVRVGLAEAWGQISADEDAQLRARLRIGAGHSGLRARMRENNAVTEEAIVAALVASGADRFEAVVATTAAMGALTAALLEWAVDAGGASLGSFVLGALALLGTGREEVRTA